jgi:hypothetical protein
MKILIELMCKLKQNKLNELHSNNKNGKNTFFVAIQHGFRKKYVGNTQIELEYLLQKQMDVKLPQNHFLR